MSGIESLSAINNRSTPVVIADQLRESIIDGAFSPGEQINVPLLAAQLNVSRGPVREALHRLVQEGLLVAKPNRGVFIEEMTLKDVAEVYEAREAIERAAAEIIVKFSSAQRETIGTRLKSIVTRMQEAFESNAWPTLGRASILSSTLNWSRKQEIPDWSALTPLSPLKRSSAFLISFLMLTLDMTR